MRILISLAALLVAGATAASAAIAPVSTEVFPGTFKRGPFVERSDPASMNAAGGEFYSLGFGGSAVFDFGSVFDAAAFEIVETTFYCVVAGAECGNHAESAQVLVSDSYVAGSGDFSGFSLVGEIGNADGVGGVSFDLTNVRYVVVVDTSDILGASFDGFDIDVASLTPTPIPAPLSIVLLGTALAGVMTLKARRASA